MGEWLLDADIPDECQHTSKVKQSDTFWYCKQCGYEYAPHLRDNTKPFTDAEIQEIEDGVDVLFGKERG